jgi:uncharacterized protein YsxB (DUF464 family)
MSARDEDNEIMEVVIRKGTSNRNEKDDFIVCTIPSTVFINAAHQETA